MPHPIGPRASLTSPSEALRLNGLDALFHGHPDGVCVVDVSGTFVESNGALAALTGYPSEQLVGMRFAQLLHPDSLDYTMARFREALTGENRRYVTRIVTPEGRIRSLDVTILPLRGTDGEVAAVLAIARDIGDVERSAAAAAGNEALVRMAARIAGFAGWVVDVVTGEIMWSEGLFHLLGLQPGRVPVDAEALALFQPQDRRAVRTAFQRTVVHGVPLDLRATIVHPSGRLMHAHLVGEPERNEIGEVVRIHGAFHDVTALVQHREEQRAMARLLRSSLDQVHDAIAFVDRSWQFTFANSWALQLVGLDESELREKTIWELFPTALGSPFEQIYRDAMENGEAGSARAYSPEWNSWFEVDAHPTEEGIAVIVRDVTEDQEARRKLEQYTRRVASQAALLDAARDAILVRDLGGMVRYWNRGAETIYGISAAEAVGRSVRDLLYEDPAEFDAASEALMRDGFWVGELRQRRADGSEIIADCRWQLSRGEDGQVTVFAVNSDITEHRRQEEQRIRAQRLESLGTLAGGIAHDLNNVLTPILMSVQLLRQDEQDERRRDMLDALDAAAQRGAAMIRQVLSFARGTEGRRELVDLPTLLAELASFCRETLPKSIELVVDAPEQLPAVAGDGTELFQVLVNLITNARDAMPDGGVVTVRAVARGDVVRLDVRDSGVGMDAATAARILEPFFTTKETGTGLGLPTSAAIVKAHGGELQVETALGAGTSIGFELPVASAGVEAPSRGGAPVPRPGRGRRVLVVDDESAICELVRQTLDHNGFVTEIAHGREALDLISQGPRFDAVVTDIMMPGVPGDVIARRVAAEQPQAAVVLMSGLLPGPGARAAVERDGAHFLAKPFTPATLLATLDAALRRRAETDPGSGAGSDTEEVLHSVLEPVLREAAAALAAGEPSEEERVRLHDLLAGAAEAAQRTLGDRARNPRIHRIVGAAASAAMALSFGLGTVPTDDVRQRLEEGLDLMAARSWPPEDQDPAAEVPR
ncbi:PAS domain S-box protein [Leifsonia sp. fls2-241-R2A-40a]|uniref:hybrid sensor histidine kinase/response regulator n=1 Tax=Leifsonia sp. fls2-241-R2A-40a TaxID=3040290 RepID=UPI0025511664|nr:PAS domain S-box protein [Leifsonia sp. fls2-241-R2A-40a]